MLLPTEFESVEADYWHLCEHVQVWDVGVERQVDIKGPDAQKLVQWMTPRDISKVVVGRCVYTPLADEHGYLINDPVALKLADDHWGLSVADSDVLLWAKGLAMAGKFDVQVHEPDVWPLAVQGPKADELMSRVFGTGVNDIRFFRFQALPFEGHKMNVARSGWSKQGGFEIYVDDPGVGIELYDALFSAGEDLQVRPGCPNLIERLESGLLSYGNDMTMKHTLLESGLDSFFDLDADTDSLSIDALRRQKKAGINRRVLGLVIPAPAGAKPVAIDPTNSFLLDNDAQPVGRLGSQAWSPRYRHQLVTVMMEQAFLDGRESIDIQLLDGTSETAQILELPFDFAAAGIT
ncbi:UNVERIFIED_CONTAM: hypothetical protein GTU68_016532 [Idotea baltica]|nr:hypothetical protein [Idotea baltica]